MLSNLRFIKMYAAEVYKSNQVNYSFQYIWSLIKFFPSWINSINTNKKSLEDEIPWITFTALEWLNNNIKPEMRVFEYGSGGSTLYFVKKVKEVVTVEHDNDWAIRIKNILAKSSFKNYKILLKEPRKISNESRNPNDPNSYLSGNCIYSGLSFDKYVCTIDQFPDEYFDIILIDGRARHSSLRHSIKKVKPNGSMILDNSERQRYSNSISNLNLIKWKRIDFFGPGPYNLYFWQTTVWMRE